MIVGIDPGMSGGVAILRLDGSVYSLEPMPVAGRDIAGAELARMFREPGVSQIEEVWLELVHSMPGDAKPAAFRFGVGIGMAQGVLATLGLRRQDVSPQRWQRALCPGDGPPKQRAAAAAVRLFPRQSLLATARSRVPHSGMVDALLIAEYGRRQWHEHGASGAAR